jgi:hypothetical protein
MELPGDLDLPFFTYGVFKSGQIAYFRLEDFVDDTERGTADGELWERDGIPILDTRGFGETTGELLWFDSEKAEEAYEEINDVEPGSQYRWISRAVRTESGEHEANLLVGIKPDKGGRMLTDSEGNQIHKWDGQRNDPFFNIALEMVEETIDDYAEHRRDDFRSFFHLQMAYLLLWTVIERYVTLRYGFGRGSSDERDELADEKPFKRGLEEEVPAQRRGVELFKTHDPDGRSNYLNTDDPKEALQYYYQVRNNVAHRGKSLHEDIGVLEDSLSELYTIFTCYVLEEAYKR